MPLIAMNREMGSLGEDVAKGLGEALGLKIQHHEIVDQLADRARLRKSHVISFLEGTQGFFERLTVDEVKLRALTADEIVSAAQASPGLILRGWGATALLKDVPHAVRVCVSAPRPVRVERMMRRLKTDDRDGVERIVDQNDEAAQAVMRRHFQVDVRDINEYDIGFNTERMSVAQCVDKVLEMVRSPQFAETEESRARLRDLAMMHRVRAALRTNRDTSRCWVRVTCIDGRAVLEGVVDTEELRDACSEVARGIHGVVSIENRLHRADMAARHHAL